MYPDPVDVIEIIDTAAAGRNLSGATLPVLDGALAVTAEGRGSGRGEELEDAHEAAAVPVIEIQTFREGRGLVAQAEVPGDDPEAAVYAAQILFGEAVALFDCFSAEKAITTVFIVDGQAVRTIQGRRP